MLHVRASPSKSTPATPSGRSAELATSASSSPSILRALTKTVEELASDAAAATARHDEQNDEELSSSAQYRQNLEVDLLQQYHSIIKPGENIYEAGEFPRGAMPSERQPCFHSALLSTARYLVYQAFGKWF